VTRKKFSELRALTMQTPKAPATVEALKSDMRAALAKAESRDPREAQSGRNSKPSSRR